MTGEGPIRVLVAGASRGIGLELTRQFLAAGDEVFAFARAPDRSDGLNALAEAHPAELRTGRLDVRDERLIASAREAVGREWNRVDVLVNNAGVYGSKDATLTTLDLDEVRQVFDTNTLGPLRVTAAFEDLLRRAPRPRLVNVTSLMGSLKDNGSGGAWAYRVSKAALNMVTRNLSHELSHYGVVTVALHPGWVRTDMGGGNAPLSVQEATRSIVATIRGLDEGYDGSFIDRDGNVLPW